MKFLMAIFCTALFSPWVYAERLPRPDHVLVVIEENRSYAQIMDAQRRDSYIHALAKRGMLLTQSYGITHPSQPNYLALFSGSTQGLSDNSCGHTFNSDNLASALLDKGLSFVGYAEGLPEVGDLSCAAGAYQRKHNPVSNWQGTRFPAATNSRFSDFPQDFAQLPTVAFVIPDQNNDMHDGSFFMADAWLKTHIDPYVEWAFKHNSLLILTWDEGGYLSDNRVVTLLVGPMVKRGQSAQRVDHYGILRTLLDFYGLPAFAASRAAEPLTNIWKLP